MKAPMFKTNNIYLNMYIQKKNYNENNKYIIIEGLLLIANEPIDYVL